MNFVEPRYPPAMSLITIGVVSFTLAKVIVRIAGGSDWADSADDIMSTVARLKRFRQRKLTKSLAEEIAGDLRGWSTAPLADNDRRAAIETVDQFLNELGSSLEVQHAVRGDDLWEWVLEHGGRHYKRDLGGQSGEYFHQLLRRCVDEIRRRTPVPGTPPDPTLQLLTGTETLKLCLEEFHQFSIDAMKRLLDDEPLHREGLERILAASISYRRELDIPTGQYIVRGAESELLNAVEGASPPWPRLVVGDAGAGKSTLLWALVGDLERMGFDPVLISTAWLMAEPQRIDSLVGAVQLLRQNATPVLLLDTVDLMLHQESQRQTFLALMEQLWAANVSVIYSTRPEERRLIQHPELRVFELKTYDDSELRLAADALAERHCPEAATDIIHNAIRDAVARGLPASDVCRNPLMLRMLFESAAPGAPEFAELDVTGLYDSYWERRVVRDARSQSAVAMRPNQQDNLASVAQTTAAALIIMGLPQEQRRKATSLASVLEPQLGSAAIEEILTLLHERGVLITDEQLFGFFHQTMLEYAFARWWLSSRDPDVLSRLVERTADGPGDLFVGAALEQVLILAVRERVDEATWSACRALVESRSGSIQSIGLAAWAHRASALRPAAQLLRSCDTAALVRTARLLPGIGGKSVGEVVSQLILLWEAQEADGPRIAVVRALARLALRDQDTVIAALEHLYPAGAVPRAERACGVTVDEPEVVQRSRHISTRPPDLLLAALVDLFECLHDRHASVVRRLCVSLLQQRGDDQEGTLLDYMAGHWQQIGDAALLEQILHILGFPEHLSPSRFEHCGNLVAEEWARRAHKCAEPLDVEQMLASFLPIFGQRIGAFAIGSLARRVEGEQLRTLTAKLVSAPDEYTAVSRTSLSHLLHTHGPALQSFAELTASACVQVRMDALSELGRYVFNFVISSPQPDKFYCRAFNLLEVDEWTAYAEFASMMLAAAAYGVESASSALEGLAIDPLTVAPELTTSIFASPAAMTIRDDHVLEQAMWLAAASGHDNAIEWMLNDQSLKGKRWQRIHERLLGRAKTGKPALFDVGERLQSLVLRHRGELVEWVDTRPALESGDDELRAKVLGKLWMRRENDSIDADRIACLSRIVTVDPGAAVPVDRVSPGIPVAVVTKAAQALHYICALRNPASLADWSMVRTLTFYLPLQSSAYVLGQSFAATCGYLDALGAQGSAEMSEMLLDLLDEVARGQFVAVDPKLWRRELINAVNHAVEIDGENAVHRLIEIGVRADPDLACVLIEGLAERWFPYARAGLINLARDAASPDLRELCQELVRQHDRSAGTRAFPDLVPSLSGRLHVLT